MGADFHKAFKNITELKQDVESNEGVLTVSMMQLRDAVGAGKLGVNVVQSIERTLRAAGLGSYPRKLPNHQDEYVRVYKQASPVGKPFRAVLTRDGNDEHDEHLREVVGNSAAMKLDKIRLVLKDED